MKEPQVTVGIMSERQIRFVFNGTYLANGVPVSGEHEAHTDGKQIFWNGNRYTRIVFTPEKEDYSFCLKEVTIGVKFHWERKESEETAEKLFVKLYNALELKEGEPEPMMNILTWYEDGKWSSCIFPRAQHRPSCYFAEGDENILLSPASVDMGGVFITPLEKDFRKIDAEHLEKILSEVCLDREKMYEIIEKLK